MPSRNKLLDNRQYLFAYISNNSFMHKLNPISKLIFLLFLTIETFIIGSIILQSALFLLVIILLLLSKIKPKFIFKKLRFMVIILLISVVLNIFFNALPNEDEIVLFYLFNVPFLPIRRLAVYFALRAFFILLTLYTSAILFTNTTSPKDFVYSMMRMRIPYKFCFAFMVGLRFIPSIEEEAKTIALAQQARGFNIEKVKTLRKAYAFISERMIGTLVSILRKGQTVSLSMENRCFGVFKNRTNLIKVKFKFSDLVFMVLIILGFIFIILYIFNFLPIPRIPSLYSIFFT
ncbi:MAG: energy-coupling factor transporter transmembrane protein EcfT [Candidatus Lokiarchaeota archaeon]|nr:energy-coupling factor transporter transmembrane protein EcfT [Candidatus Lokiarchaeota archaeon]